MTKRAADEWGKPVFMDRERLRYELSLTESTFDEWLADGTIEAAHAQRGRKKLWHWPTVEARFAPKADTVVDLDPYIQGARNATKGVRRGHA